MSAFTRFPECVDSFIAEANLADRRMRNNITSHESHDQPSSKQKKSKMKKSKSIRPTLTSFTTCMVARADSFSMDSLTDILKSMNVSGTADLRIRPRGIINERNSCFLSACLQVLFNLKPFVSVMLSAQKTLKQDNHIDIVADLPVFSQLFKTFEEYYVSYPSNNSLVASTTPPIKLSDGLFNKLDFQRGSQEDASESLNRILTLLHEEISHSQGQIAPSASAKHVAKGHSEGWFTKGRNGAHSASVRVVSCSHCDYSHSPRVIDQTQMDGGEAGSFVKSTFSGSSVIHTSLLNSRTLKQELLNAIQEPFFILPLPVTGHKESISSLLEHLSAPESVTDYVHDKLHESRVVSRKMTIDQLPPVLILQLKRFLYEDDRITKCMDHVSVERNITIPSCLLEKGKKLSKARRSYKLAAVVFHVGFWATRGHYTTALAREQDLLYVDDDRMCTIRNHPTIQRLLSEHTPFSANRGSFEQETAAPNANPPIGEQPRTPYLCVYINEPSIL